MLHSFLQYEILQKIINFTLDIIEMMTIKRLNLIIIKDDRMKSLLEDFALTLTSE